jgi:hypothetical protein
MRNVAIGFALLAIIAQLALALSPALRRWILGADDTAERAPAARRTPLDARD